MVQQDEYVNVEDYLSYLICMTNAWEDCKDFYHGDFLEKPIKQEKGWRLPFRAKKEEDAKESILSDWYDSRIAKYRTEYSRANYYRIWKFNHIALPETLQDEFYQWHHSVTLSKEFIH